MKTERVLYVQNIHLHSHTVDLIQAVKLPCLSFPICKMVQVRICFFTTIKFLLPPQFPCVPTFISSSEDERREIIIRIAYKQVYLIPSQRLRSLVLSLPRLYACWDTSALRSHPQRCGEGLPSLTSHSGSYPLMPTKHHKHHNYIPYLPKYLNMN